MSEKYKHTHNLQGHCKWHHLSDFGVYMSGHRLNRQAHHSSIQWILIAFRCNFFPSLSNDVLNMHERRSIVCFFFIEIEIYSLYRKCWWWFAIASPLLQFNGKKNPTWKLSAHSELKTIWIALSSVRKIHISTVLCIRACERDAAISSTIFMKCPMTLLILIQN